jgi:uncharacterized membrane protein HdeD (DUF308 family)
METISRRQLTRRRVLGFLVMGLGLLVLFMPIFTGEWVIGLLGLAFIAGGLFQFVVTLRSDHEGVSLLSYVSGIASIVLGFVLFLSPSMVLSGLLIAVSLFLVAEGAIKVYVAHKEKGQDRWWNLFNGLFTLSLGLLIWFFISAHLGIVAIGIVLGVRLLVEGWTMFFLPERSLGASAPDLDTRRHPDNQLAVEPSDVIKDMQETILKSGPIVSSQDVVWCVTLFAIFFAIHVLRTDANWTFIGFISPLTAVIGDAIVALLVAIALLLPLRLLWRKLTRPLEVAAWNRFTQLRASGTTPTVLERGLSFWLGNRMTFAIEMRAIRYSLNYALWRVLRIGLPLTAILIAVNSIWGFSWYFNSENWASAVWQEITKTRVDVWREQMAEAAERFALSKGVAPDKVFAVTPPGVDESGDFGFVVIGDTGEGDSSQLSLHDQLIAADKREHVKFLVLSSDVIYPDGKMKDYEKNFYLPFKGFEKPIYAIPGNHDWFDADEGFNANFLDRESAKLALAARLRSDLKTDVINNDQRFLEIVDEAARLREYYRIKNGMQRGPYFEFHTPRFSLIAVDTGILKRVDAKQKAWLEAALHRAGNNFKMVVLGHPFYVAGANQAKDDRGFDEILQMLKSYSVDIAMAGDTHDFEFYKLKYDANGKQGEMLHFVNGGGGAYLSIGTSIGFPQNPVTPDYAFYPRTDELTAKIRNEAPFWKMPFFFWMQWLHGYPFTDEVVSGAFDFNSAPFFQSFLEVNVERSQNRVRLLLYGVNGPLRWRDIQVAGQVKPADKSDDDPVEFIAPLHP